MSLVEKVMRKFYRKAEGHPEKLPWHREEPGKLLMDAIKARGGRGRALDVGCGAGVFSVWMAQQGLQVTGIDLFPEAIAMGRARAKEKGVSVEFIQTDVFDYVPDRPFDLVLDSGCLHALMRGNVEAYKRQLFRWLAPGGDYILAHWGKLNPFDWRPIGPRRRSEETIKRIFTSDLELVETSVTDFETPLPFGPKVRGVEYWFHRKN